MTFTSAIDAWCDRCGRGPGGLCIDASGRAQKRAHPERIAMWRKLQLADRLATAIGYQELAAVDPHELGVLDRTGDPRDMVTVNAREIRVLLEETRFLDRLVEQ